MFQAFSQEHHAFRQAVMQWAQKEITPHALLWDELGEFPKDVFRKAGKLGFLGTRFDPNFGGAGLDYWYSLIWMEEIARAASMSAAMGLMVQTDVVIPVIQELGTIEQKSLFLKPLISGEMVGSLGISEAGCGSDVAAMKTTAVLDGDDYVINGSKMWITNGCKADVVVLAVRTAPNGYKGISLVTLPTDIKGFSVGKKLKKIGNLASDTAILYFDNCRIPKRFLLGEENQGFYTIMSNFQSERLGAAIIAASAIEYMLAQTLTYAKERTLFGKPVIQNQIWQHKLAEHQTNLEAGKLLVYRAAKLFDDFLQKKHLTSPIKEITMAKLYCCDLAQKIAYDCQQLFGGMGYMEETPIARAWRDVRALTIAGGTSEVMKEILIKLEKWS